MEVMWPVKTIILCCMQLCMQIVSISDADGTPQFSWSEMQIVKKTKDQFSGLLPPNKLLLNDFSKYT